MTISFPTATGRPLASPRGFPGRLRSLGRLRYQLLGALLFAVAIPEVFNRLLTAGSIVWLPAGTAQHTVLGTALAVLIAIYAFRRMTSYPGARTLACAAPVVASAYLVVIVAFFFLRLDYSRTQFVLSLGLAAIWFLAVAHIQARSLRPRFLVLPFGAIDKLGDIRSADWVTADSPQHALDRYSALVADLRMDMPDAWQRMIASAALAGVPVYHVKQLTEALTGRVEIEHLSENNLGSLLPSSLYLRFQRLGDFVLAIAALPIVLPILAIAGIFIKADDGGPIFFRQERMGYRGRVFTMLKLRTMCQNADARGSFTTDHDPRVTRTGRFLRRLRIDELPQIWNILRGEMSWIGPRPEALTLSQWYELRIPFYCYRHIVRPGISGWAAVHQGNVAEVEQATLKLQYDFYYIRNFGLWLDLLIAAKTLKTVFTGFGAK